MAKQGFEILDLESGNKYILETANDVLSATTRLILPERDGTLALVKDVEDLSAKITRGDITVGDSNKLDGRDSTEFANSDLSNVVIPQEVKDALRGYTGSQGSVGPQGPQGNPGAVGLQGYTGSKGLDGVNGYNGSTGFTGSRGADGVTGSQGIQGYTGSKGDAGAGFNISKVFNSLSELLAGTTTNDTFGLVAGTLSPDADDYGKLYLYKNSTWTFITDMSVKGAAGITGPQGIQGTQGYTGSVGAQGIQGIQGYTGSTGATGPQGPQGPAGVDGIGGGSNPNVIQLMGQQIDLYSGSYFTIDGMFADMMYMAPGMPNPAGQTNSFVLEITNGGMSTINWGNIGLVRWPGGTAPTLTASGTDLLGFITTDHGSSWKGLILGKDIK